MGGDPQHVWNTLRVDEGARQFGILARNPNSRHGAENVRVLDADDTQIYSATANYLARLIGLMQQGRISVYLLYSFLTLAATLLAVMR